MYNYKYFLATNSAEGFYSAFDRCYSAEDGWRAFIIKGGPGTGKSSFMKYFAVKAGDKGYKFLLCPCSSDPNSLDAVILPDKKIVIMDGTAPHTVDPVAPGICEKILNFGDFWSEKAFLNKSHEILSISRKNKALHKTASRYITAAGKLIADNYKTALLSTDKEKAVRVAEKLCVKYIPKNKKAPMGREWVRFIEGITPLGIVSYSSTILSEAQNAVIIRDDMASASNIIMEYIRDYALANGYETVTLKNQFLPSLITDHIILPELSLAFATENRYIHFKDESRRIHARRFVSQSQLHQSRERLKFNKRAIKELLLAAAEALASAKVTHDKLEDYYIKAMDFNALTAFAEEFTERVLNES